MSESSIGSQEGEDSVDLTTWNPLPRTSLFTWYCRLASRVGLFSQRVAGHGVMIHLIRMFDLLCKKEQEDWHPPCVASYQSFF